MVTTRTRFRTLDKLVITKKKKWLKDKTSRRDTFRKGDETLILIPNRMGPKNTQRSTEKIRRESTQRKEKERWVKRREGGESKRERREKHRHTHQNS